MILASRCGFCRAYDRFLFLLRTGIISGGDGGSALRLLPPLEAPNEEMLRVRRLRLDFMESHDHLVYTLGTLVSGAGVGYTSELSYVH